MSAVVEHCTQWRCVNHCKGHDCEHCEFFCTERRIEAREALRDFRG